jgi:integrase
MDFLINVKLFGMDDALFPKAKVGLIEGQGFGNLGLSRECYANTGPLRKIIRKTFANVKMKDFTPHSFRKTLTKHGNDVCKTMADWKAWSKNLRHDNIATTINSCMPMTTQEQLETMRKLNAS